MTPAADDDGLIRINLLEFLRDWRRDMQDDLKSLHDELRDSVTGIKADIAGKADRTEVAVLSAKLETHATQLNVLNEDKVARDATRATHRERNEADIRRRNLRIALWGFVGTLVLAAVTVIPQLLR